MASNAPLSPRPYPGVPRRYLGLVPHGAVADGNGAGLRQAPGGLSHEEGPDEHHGPIGQLVAYGLHVGAVRLHLGGNTGLRPPPRNPGQLRPVVLKA